MADSPHAQMADYYLTEARGHMDPTGLATAAVAESNLAIAYELRTANMLSRATYARENGVAGMDDVDMRLT